MSIPAATYPIAPEDILAFEQEGVLLIQGFFDQAQHLQPMQRDLHRVIGYALQSVGALDEQKNFSTESFDSGLQFLVKNHRALAANIYDTVKKLPNYIRLASDERFEKLAKQLLRSNFVGFASRGWGTRLDHPNEDKYITQLHQDYVSQLCSPSGVVYWSPLRNITPELGPVQIFPRSHRNGIYPVRVVGSGSYGLRIVDEADIASTLPSISPSMEAGDLLILHALTLHMSAPNRSNVTRWAMISRYFDFQEKTGRSYGWKGGLQEGNSFGDIHPDLVKL